MGSSKTTYPLDAVCRSIPSWERRVALQCDPRLPQNNEPLRATCMFCPKYFTVHLRNANEPTSHTHAEENSRVNPPKLSELGHHGSSEGPTQNPVCPKDAAKR